jgi:hypothetical protein
MLFMFILYFRFFKLIEYMFDQCDDILLFENETSAKTSRTTTSNYAKNFLIKLSLMRDNVDLCDFRIDINNKQIFCHKFLLIAASDYFRAMFNGL